MDRSIHSTSYKQMIALLRAKRIENNITQEQLASNLGVNQGVVSKIETCERRIDVIELMNICRCINIDFIEFVTEINKL